MLLLLLASPIAPAAGRRKKKKRQRVSVPLIPSDLDVEGSCPFHKQPAEASAKELSAFGLELQLSGRQLEASHCYAAAVRAHPAEADGWLNLGLSQQSVDRSLAIHLYQHGLSLKPTAVSYNMLGVMYRDAERHDHAVAQFEAAVQLKPSSADALFNLGCSHAQLGRYTDALRAYRIALERERKNEARIQNNIGQVLGKLERWNEAIAALHEAEEADEAFPETQLNLAEVLKSQGQLAAAHGHYMAAARLMPDQAANLTAEAEALVGRIDEQARLRRANERRAEIERREGPMTKEQRLERYQRIVGACGMDDKVCMKKLLGQDYGDEDEVPIF